MRIAFGARSKPGAFGDMVAPAFFYVGAGALVYVLDVGLPTDLRDPWLYAYIAGWPVVVMWYLLKVMVFASLAVACLFALSVFEQGQYRSRIRSRKAVARRPLKDYERIHGHRS